MEVFSGWDFEVSILTNERGFPVIRIWFEDQDGEHVHEYQMRYKDEPHKFFKSLLKSMMDNYFDSEVLGDIEEVFRKIMDEYDMNDRWYANILILLTVLRAVAYQLPISLSMCSGGEEE